MTPKPAGPSTVITDRFVNSICKRLQENKPVRRTLPIWGRLHIDRQLPFLVVYRRPFQDEDSETVRLIIGEASYLFASGSKKLHDGLSSLILNIGNTLKPLFGSFLLIEIWAGRVNVEANQLSSSSGFRIVHNQSSEILATVEALESELKRIKVSNQAADVLRSHSRKISPPKLSSLISSDEAIRLGWHHVGIEVRPVYMNSDTGEVYPLIRRGIHRALSRAIQKTVFEFVRMQTTHLPPHFHSLGRRKVVKAVWEVDRKLAQVSSTFDFLLLATPIDADAAFKTFKKNKLQKMPQFSYRPTPIDPALIKRQLYAIPIERIEDPTLSLLFRQQQTEMDRKITMINDRGSKQFLYESLQLFGRVDESLLKLARKILQEVPSRSRDEMVSRSVPAEALAARALEELDYFRVTYPNITSQVELRSDIIGLMVSRGNLLIGKGGLIPESRIEGLIQHEVGTHILTYINGQAQPFRQLYIGLPGYDELQEGLAVLAEYLVGGLTRPRLRLLAARVVAVNSLIGGASFIDVFEELDRNYDFAQRTAFMITMRVFRAGGLTKDASYLRGLVRLLKYLKEGGAIEPLFIGKIAANHLSVIQELQWRLVLGPAPLRPRYMDLPQTTAKLGQLRNGLSVLDLVERR